MRMKRYFFVLTALLWLLPFAMAAQDLSYRQIAGKVVDASNGKPLHYASVGLAGTDVSNVTNSEGFFTLKIDPATPEYTLVTITFIGYSAQALKLSDFRQATPEKPLRISLIPTTLTLDPAIISAHDPEELLKAALQLTGVNYPTENVGMTAFYREMVKKGNAKYLMMNEAILDIDKAPYESIRSDKVGIYKGRGSTNYDATDTLLIKYQGGAVSVLQIDQVKNPFALADADHLGDFYDFAMDPVSFLGTRTFYVVRFNQKSYIEEILMRGRVFIDSETLAIGRVEMQMNVEGHPEAYRLFVVKRPQDTKFEVESASYVVNYKPSGDKWYYDYALMEVKFKTRRRHALFTTHYTVLSEIAVTDHRPGPLKIDQDARIRFRDQMNVKVSAFTDPNYWENYNVIEPDADIEAIIRKIVRQLKRHNME